MRPRENRPRLDDADPASDTQPKPTRSHRGGGQASAAADWDTIERHGGLDAALKNINQSEQKTPASNSNGMIDDFRLRGSRTWRRMGDTATKGGLRT